VVEAAAGVVAEGSASHEIQAADDAEPPGHYA
jgi:hypothetical protein